MSRGSHKNLLLSLRNVDAKQLLTPLAAWIAMGLSGCGSITDLSAIDAQAPQLATGGNAPKLNAVTSTGGASGTSGGATSSDTACTLLGSWDTISQPWNNMSTASVITFNADGTFTGVPAYSGLYKFDGTKLVIWNDSGSDMNCPYDAQWTVQFDAGCASATLLPDYDNCTGARRYLDWNVKLVSH